MKTQPFSHLRRTCALAGLALSLMPLAHAQPQPLEKVTFMTEWAPHGFHAPLYLAVQKGWFKEAGLDVEIKDGRGSGSTISLVGAGQVDVGFVNLSAAVVARSKGVPIKAVASILRKNTVGLVMKQGSGIHAAEQLRGKTILYSNGTIEAQVFEGYLRRAGMSRSDVRLLGVDSQAKVASVLSGKGDAAVGPIPFYLALLADKPEKLDTILFADAKQTLMDFGLVANDVSIAKRPDVVRRFVKVVSLAYDYSLLGDNIQEAVQAMVTLRPTANIDRVLAVHTFRTHAAHIASPATAGRPTGYLAAEDMQDTVQTLKDVQVIDEKLKADDTYTLTFNP